MPDMSYQNHPHIFQRLLQPTLLLKVFADVKCEFGTQYDLVFIKKKSLPRRFDAINAKIIINILSDQLC